MSGHSPDCDTKDTVIEGKPCNCHVWQTARIVELEAKFTALQNASKALLDEVTLMFTELQAAAWRLLSVARSPFNPATMDEALVALEKAANPLIEVDLSVLKKTGCGTVIGLEGQRCGAPGVICHDCQGAEEDSWYDPHCSTCSCLRKQPDSAEVDAAKYAEGVENFKLKFKGVTITPENAFEPPGRNPADRV